MTPFCHCLGRRARATLRRFGAAYLMERQHGFEAEFVFHAGADQAANAVPAGIGMHIDATPTALGQQIQRLHPGHLCLLLPQQRAAVPLRRQTANRLISRGRMAISRPKVISHAADLPHITSAVLR